MDSVHDLQSRTQQYVASDLLLICLFGSPDIEPVSMQLRKPVVGLDGAALELASSACSSRLRRSMQLSTTLQASESALSKLLAIAHMWGRYGT
jgi:hypothetical protein